MNMKGKRGIHSLVGRSCSKFVSSMILCFYANIKKMYLKYPGLVKLYRPKAKNYECPPPPPPWGFYLTNFFFIAGHVRSII